PRRPFHRRRCGAIELLGPAWPAIAVVAIHRVAQAPGARGLVRAPRDRPPREALVALVLPLVPPAPRCPAHRPPHGRPLPVEQLHDRGAPLTDIVPGMKTQVMVLSILAACTVDETSDPHALVQASGLGGAVAAIAPAALQAT